LLILSLPPAANAGCYGTQALGGRVLRRFGYAAVS
jgi:hypothetical protein